MSQTRDHLLLPPLEQPGPPQYRTDPAALKNAARLYDQLRAKGYSVEQAERMSMVGRVSGAVIHYEEA